MAKKITGFLKLQVPAGSANPSPPIGPALGQRGLNIMEFCKAFNAQTQKMDKGTPIPVVITIYADRSYSFITKTPPAAILLKRAANIAKGSGVPNKNKVATVTRQEMRRDALAQAIDGQETDRVARRLEDAGVLRLNVPEQQARGRPVKRWLVNPRLRET